MPRKPLLDRDALKVRVAEAVHGLRGEGVRKATLPLVREWLERRYEHAGGQAILQDVLKEVVAEIAAADRSGAPAISMPAEVETIVAASIQTIWRVASHAAFEDFEAKRAQAEIEVSEANASRELAESQFAALEQRYDALEGEMDKAGENIRELEQKLAAAAARAASEKAAFAALETSLRRQTEEATSRVEQAQARADATAAALEQLIARLGPASPEPKDGAGQGLARTGP